MVRACPDRYPWSWLLRICARCLCGVNSGSVKGVKGCRSRGVCEGMPTMAKRPVGGFAELLQRLRVRAGMTQGELAEAAEVSPRTVSDLERGVNRTARKDTAELLAAALGLIGHEREQFLATARGKPTAAEQAARAQVAAQAAAEAFEAAPGVASAKADAAAGAEGGHDDADASNL